MRGRIALYAGKKKPAPGAEHEGDDRELRDRRPARTRPTIDDRRDREEVDELDDPHDQPARDAVGDDAARDRAEQQPGGVGRGDERQVDGSAADRR